MDPHIVFGPEAKGPLNGLAVCLWHGAGGDINQVHLQHLADTLPQLGATVVLARFSYRVNGKRAPDRMPKLLLAMRETLAACEPHTRGKKLVLGGRSMGGRAASMLLADQAPPRVDGLLFLSYPLHSAKKPDVLRDAHLYPLSTPMLFVQGERDALCRREALDPVIKKLGDRATLSVTPGDHSMKKLGGEALDGIVHPWLQRLAKS